MFLFIDNQGRFWPSMFYKNLIWTLRADAVRPDPELEGPTAKQGSLLQQTLYRDHALLIQVELLQVHKVVCDELRSCEHK